MALAIGTNISPLDRLYKNHVTRDCHVVMLLTVPPPPPPPGPFVMVGNKWSPRQACTITLLLPVLYIIIMMMNVCQHLLEEPEHKRYVSIKLMTKVTVT